VAFAQLLYDAYLCPVPEVSEARVEVTTRACIFTGASNRSTPQGVTVCELAHPARLVSAVLLVARSPPTRRQNVMTVGRLLWVQEQSRIEVGLCSLAGLARQFCTEVAFRATERGNRRVMSPRQEPRRMTSARKTLEDCARD
jgi:hypothetical protein